MTSIYIEIDDSSSKIKFNNSKVLDTKESIKIVKILNELSEQIAFGYSFFNISITFNTRSFLVISYFLLCPNMI